MTRAYYQQQRAKGNGHHAAVRALAYKWTRILFRCWKDRTPYNEQTYQDALRRRGLRLWTVNPDVNPDVVKVQWKSAETSGPYALPLLDGATQMTILKGLYGACHYIK